MSESEGAQRQRRIAGQPMFVLSEDTERTSGRDAQSANIQAGKAVAESVRTTLGPNGMDKMLVSDSGDVVVTNDGATVLEEMDIEHPAAEMLVDVAESQDEEVGDGTTTAAALAGELLSETEELLENDVHPTTIVEGYLTAREVALETVEELTLEGEVDNEILQQVAETAMTGKGTGGVTPSTLADAVVEAVRHVDGDGDLDRDAIEVVARAGRSSAATEVIEGVIADADYVGRERPAPVSDAAVAILDADLDLAETEVDAEYQIGNVDQLNAAVESEREQYRDMAESVVDADADVLVTTGEVADTTAGILAREGVVVFEDVSSSTARTIARATGAGLLGTVDGLESDDLGAAETVRVESYDDDDLAFFEGGAAADTVTLFLRGGTEGVLDELERAVTDGVDAAVAALNTGGVVPGAAAVEIAVAGAIREAAAGVEGREQLAVEAFADAVDAIPRTLATTAGEDPIDALADLRAANGDGRAGLVSTGGEVEVADPVDHGVLDPAEVKREVFRNATEASTLITRIDDVISAN
nr:thermosome subunit alpha [Halalkaliarchaeum desulfuricum]